MLKNAARELGVWEDFQSREMWRIKVTSVVPDCTRLVGRHSGAPTLHCLGSWMDKILICLFEANRKGHSSRSAGRRKISPTEIGCAAIKGTGTPFSFVSEHIVTSTFPLELFQDLILIKVYSAILCRRQWVYFIYFATFISCLVSIKQLNSVSTVFPGRFPSRSCQTQICLIFQLLHVVLDHALEPMHGFASLTMESIFIGKTQS